MTTKGHQTTKIKQIDIAKAALVELRPNITTQDREEAQKELNLSEPTVSRYLNGEAKKLHTALELLKFLRRRIKERERELAA